MNRYDIGIEDLGGLIAPRLDITEQSDGEWVKWVDVKESCLRTAERIYVLEYALRQLAETAERCDSWDVFPCDALEKAYKALGTFF